MLRFYRKSRTCERFFTEKILKAIAWRELSAAHFTAENTGSRAFKARLRRENVEWVARTFGEKSLGRSRAAHILRHSERNAEVIEIACVAIASLYVPADVEAARARPQSSATCLLHPAIDHAPVDVDDD